MFTENHISVNDLVCALSEAVDLVSRNLSNHHKKVAYLAYSIAQKMKLPSNDIQDIILASLLHDIGAFTLEERIKLSSFESSEDGPNQHAIFGYKLLSGFAPLEKAAELIRHHHADYIKTRDRIPRDGIPVGSYIIHLADRISVLIDDRHEILKQVPEALATISKKRSSFHPQAFQAFTRLAFREAFWMEAFLPSSNSSIVAEKIKSSGEINQLETLRKFSEIFAQIIDFRSRFTATHSSGVAAVAMELAAIDGFSRRECQLMEIAGLFHDLGKLAIPSKILEKNGSLDEEELNCIKKHTYYTHLILRKIKGLERITLLAAFHHERIDGTGYPFRIKGRDLSKLARIMAVSDIMTALMEDRPYRLGMGKEETIRTLFMMAENGRIDKGIVALANDNFRRIDEARIRAQSKAQKDYEAFYEAVVDMETYFKHEISSSSLLSAVPAALMSMENFDEAKSTEYFH